MHHSPHEKGRCLHVNAYASKAVMLNYKSVEILSFSVYTLRLSRISDNTGRQYCTHMQEIILSLLGKEG